MASYFWFIRPLFIQVPSTSAPPNTSEQLHRLVLHSSDENKSSSMCWIYVVGPVKVMTVLNPSSDSPRPW